MEIAWEVEDGYVGKSRPQHTTVDDQELSECDTIDEAMELGSNSIQEAFENDITWCYTNQENVKDEIKLIITNKKEQNNGRNKRNT